MGVLKYKLLRDLWGQKGRTLQVILIIGIGAGAIGMILTIRMLLIPEMQRLWQTMNPAMIDLSVFPPLEEGELDSLATQEGVVEIEGANRVLIEWRLSPQDEWQQGMLTARGDFQNQRLFMVELWEGAWPQGKLMALGQDTGPAFGVPSPGEVFIRIGEQETLVRTGGTVYDMNAQPAAMPGGMAQFYITQNYFARLVGHHSYNRVLINAAVYDEEAVIALADRVQEKLETQGKESGRTISDPSEHSFQDVLDGLFFIMTLMGLLALVLGLLLVYNTINTLLSQQVDQIGVMKAVGARTWQVLRLYLVNILAYSFLALVISLPIGMGAGWLVLKWLVTYFGADPGPFQYSPVAVTAQVTIALLAPLVASVIPVLSGARVTVREAISTYGLRTRAGLLERLLARARWVSRLVLITISNTFRNNWRVALLQVALVLSGLVFMMVISVRDSVVYSTNQVVFDIFAADIALAFKEPQRIHHVEALTLAHPEVEAVEMWGQASGTIRLAGQLESEDDEAIAMLGVPLPTRLYNYRLIEGRWLYPEDGYAVVLSERLAEDAGVWVGDWVTLKYGEHQERNWQVVGLVLAPLNATSGFMPRERLLRELRKVDQAETVWIETVSDDPRGDAAVAERLRAYYEHNHVEVSPLRGLWGAGDSTYEMATANINSSYLIVALLGLMSIVIGTVGAIALSGALSLSVLERRREIGVLRAIGASSWTVARMFIGEGLILGWLSWLIALPLSIPAGKLMLVGLERFLGAGEMIYVFTPIGSTLWFVIISVISILASGLPSRGAVRISVRESLAYQ